MSEGHVQTKAITSPHDLGSGTRPDDDPLSKQLPLTLEGSCFCKLTTFKINFIDRSDLTLSAFCHCSSCQRLNGAPFVHTTHWRERSVVWDVEFGGETGEKPEGLSDGGGGGGEGEGKGWVQRFESMKGRKWKLRCGNCGSPLGSWNAGKSEWSIWPATLERDPETLRVRHVDDLLRPTAHQFYGPWRSVDLDGDGIGKWDGYEGKSQRVG